MITTPFRTSTLFVAAALALTAVFPSTPVAASASVPAPAATVPAAARPVQSVSPARLLDTRPGEPTIDGKYSGGGQRPARTSLEIQVTGRAHVPTGASGAMLNVTAIFPKHGTALTVFPCGIPRPGASNLNVPVGDIRANNAFVKLSPRGTVCVYVSEATDVIIDVTGFVPADGSPVSVNPARILETRRGYRTVDGKYQGIGRRPTGSSTELQVAGRAGVPLDATAAFLNVTAIFPRRGTVITLYPCGTSIPFDASNLNVPVGDIRANNVFVKLNERGAVCIYTAATTDLIVDVNGYTPNGSTPYSTFPQRMMDTRPGYHTYDGTAAGIGRRPAGSVTPLPINGRGEASSKTGAVLLTVTAVTPDAGTAITVYPCGTRPRASNLNVPAGDIRANGVFVQLSAKGTVCIATDAATDIIVDLNGYVPRPVTTSMCRPTITRLPNSECAALVAIYNATQGADGQLHGAWGTNTDPCTWSGVTCGNALDQAGHVHVDQLKLARAKLTGAVPSAIGQLTSLTWLVLDDNSLTSLPPEIGKLARLERFTMQNNLLTSLPTQISGMKALNTLDVSGNQITSLPTQIGALAKLNTLDVSKNLLTALPVQIGNLARLIALDVSQNGLANLPVSVGGLPRLTQLYANDNVMEFDVTGVFGPLKARPSTAGDLRLKLSGNTCLTTTDAALAAWLTARDPLWNDGC